MLLKCGPMSLVAKAVLNAFRPVYLMFCGLKYCGECFR